MGRGEAPISYCPHGTQRGRRCAACETLAQLSAEAARQASKGSLNRAEAASRGRAPVTQAHASPHGAGVSDVDSASGTDADDPSEDVASTADDTARASSESVSPGALGREGGGGTPVGLHRGVGAEAEQEVPTPSFSLGPLWGTAQTQGARFSGRYRLCMGRRPDGEYWLSEQLLSEDGQRVVGERQLVGPDGFDWVYDKMLEHVVDRFAA